MLEETPQSSRRPSQTQKLCSVVMAAMGLFGAVPLIADDASGDIETDLPLLDPQCSTLVEIPTDRIVHYLVYRFRDDRKELECADALLEDPQFPEEKKLALVRGLAHREEMIERLFRSNKSISSWREAALRSYVKPGGFWPRSLDPAAYIQNPEYEVSEKLIILEWLGNQAKHPFPSTQEKARALLRTIASDETGGVLREEAIEIEADIREHDEAERQRRLEQRVRQLEEMKRLERLLEEADPGDADMWMVQAYVGNARLAFAKDALECTYSAIDSYSRTHKRLPQTLEAIRLYVEGNLFCDGWDHLMYFPLSVEELGKPDSEAIVLIHPRALDLGQVSRPDEERILLVWLLASGQVGGATQSTFAELWEKSNKARVAGSADPISDAFLNEMGLDDWRSLQKDADEEPK